LKQNRKSCIVSAMKNHERELGSNFAEFLQAMQYISNQSQCEMAEGLSCSQPTYSRWINGQTPGKLGQIIIADVFELESNELKQLQIGTYLELANNFFDEIPRSQLLRAFVIRAQEGPALTEHEVGLIKFLLEDREQENNF